MPREFNYEIKKQIAVLAKSEKGDYTTELNLISYNGGEAKYDIRKWDRRNDRMLKGVTLTDEEMDALKRALEVL